MNPKDKQILRLVYMLGYEDCANKEAPSKGMRAMLEKFNIFFCTKCDNEVKSQPGLCSNCV